MSRETLQWLNTKTLVTFTAWHRDAESLEGLEDNRYDKVIPVADVQRRLFDPLKVYEGDVTATSLTDEGVIQVTDPERKSIIVQFGTEEPALVGLFKQGYKVHGYNEWLLHNLDLITHGGLHVTSAGLLAKGAVAWVQAELNTEAITTPEGVKFFPYVLAATSLDGSLASTYLNGAQVVQCDNTLSAATRAKDSRKVKIRHSRNSLGRIQDVRDGLALQVKATADDFAAKVADLCSTKVSDKQWQAFLDLHSPLSDEQGERKAGRGLTIALNEQDALKRLWRHDERVSPWAGTAFGVLQAVNTWEHWEQTVKGDRAERNALRKVKGEWDNSDATTLDLLDKILQSA